MMPGQGGGGNHRLPPAWGPEMECRGENSYPFRHWSRDLLLWTVAHQDMENSQKAALLLSQLRGAAQVLTREIPIEIILNGADVNGRRVDPVTYILTMLADRYAQLGEEARLKAMSEIFEFHRRGNERIDDLLARFSTVQQRAQGQGMVALPYESLSWILLRACQPNDQQLLMLLQGFGGRYPNNEAEFRQLERSLRRMGHILENSPDNIAQQLRHDRGHRHPLYMMTQGWSQSQ